MIGLLALAAAATVRPQTVLTIDRRHRLVEGVASDGKTIWVSSVMDRTILTCARTCRTLAILPKGLHPLGIAWDKTRDRLWVTADCPQVDPIPKCDRGALLGLDRNGRIKIRVTPSAATFHPGDVSATGGGVFVSDSLWGLVYRLEESGRLVALFPPAKNRSAQGTALTPDGKHLILADYSQGIVSIDLATGARTLLPLANGKPLRGVDGLTRCGSIYYGIYNGATPGTFGHPGWRHARQLQPAARRCDIARSVTGGV